MRRSIVAAAAVGVTALALSGCAGGTAEPGGEGAQTIKIAVQSDPGTLNPITNATNASESVSTFGYESLLFYPTGEEPKGLLAESWESTTTSVEFTLKDGILCVDGTPLTATDVKSTFEYAAADETGSPYKGVYFPAEGLTIEADDDAGTVTFTSAAAQSFLAETIGALPIVCASGLDDPAVLDTEFHGTGAYALEASSPGQSYTFTLRDDYTWGVDDITSKTAGLPGTVEISIIESDSTAANLLQTGEANIAEVGGSERDRLESTEFAQELEVPLRPGLIFFNQAEGRVGHDLAVRQALAQAVDRESVGPVASAGRGEQITTLVSEFGAACTAMDSSAAIPSYDVDAAAAALDDAGWVEGADGIRAKDGKPLSILMLYPASESQGVTAAIELLQTEFKKIGVDAVPTPSASYTDVIFSGGDWDIVWAPIFTSLPSDWAGILGGEFPPNGGNWTYNANQEYFDLVGEAQALAGADSCDAWQAAQDSLFSNLEVLPVYSSTSTFYGAGAEFGMSKSILAPTTIRVTE
ncbi:ABC transporter substrate-binding protein [Microbacterium saperdae]|uniref:Peptide/nickel transport system substrate-binding protein n=1 Tax=Microbacterium saperdae TaxID=69368 RepID=A0A543BPY1_9MICO|nr:ABC transporter substrate-binding protein [Microbacterium saperdae]TQL86880.1 peptide/nickel transport system substrate-binding protein [Microbacterium saperdae]GGM44673.1 peptide ABC transporter substrate-binding protein [Microbacterium saperdae]